MLPLRLKRLRRTASIRNMLRETHLNIAQFIAPLFINESLVQNQPIQAMPGQYQLSLSHLATEVTELAALGIQAVLLFGIPASKDALGSSSLRDEGIIQQAIRIIRRSQPHMTIIADVCLCEYTDHGHCGVLCDMAIDNDATLDVLATQAVSYAQAGADWVAPSSMTDGMVGAIRHALDKAQYQHVAILSYAVKYNSAFYGPFREAALGAPKFGDRRTYQMDPANQAESLREAYLDITEGTDLIMVKPAMNYLDIIAALKREFPSIPLCAYQVSGEYAMLKLAAKHGMFDEKIAMFESLTAIKRAGADLIISYYTKELADHLLNKLKTVVT